MIQHPDFSLKRNITHLLKTQPIGESVVIMGWFRSKRDYPDFSFVEVNDGSCLANLQVVFDRKIPGFEKLQSTSTGASLWVRGLIKKSPGKEQPIEVEALEFGIFHPSDPAFPIQKKGIKFETLRDFPHLRTRTNTFGALFRVRSELALAIHRFYGDRGFLYVHTPIITSSDCEGAGELFRVTTLDLENPPRLEGQDGGRPIDFKADFFGKPTFLTVSGQLAVEGFCCALGNVYTFGPTFRSENSNTPRHAAEFWMIEPEIAFAGLKEDMLLAEEMVKFLADHILKNCAEDMEFFEQRIQKGVIARLAALADRPFARCSYTEAIAILEKSGKKFEYPVKWGIDLQTEHERFLAEEHFKGPVFVHDYPRHLKAFYMFVNDDGKTVGAMDLLVPGVGELIGGSCREHRLEKLEERLRECKIPMEDYQWYLDLRRYGSIPHAGFGLGFERMLLYITGMQNIRDSIPYPRTPGQALC